MSFFLQEKIKQKTRFKLASLKVGLFVMLTFREFIKGDLFQSYLKT